MAAGVALLVAAGDRLITTDSEAVERALDEMAEGLLARDAEAALAPVADDFEQEEVTKPALLSAARRFLKQSPPRALEWIQRTVETADGSGTAKVRIRYLPAPPSPVPYPIDTVWEIGFAERDGRWTITRIVPVEIAGQRITGLPRVLRMANTGRAAD